MNNRRDEPSTDAGHGLEAQVHAAKTAIATRMRHLRHHHPEGPFSLAKLADRTGVSKRTLASAESADGTNLTIETLVKVAHSLGIERWAYFLDEQVFQQVNAELEAVKELRRRSVENVSLRTRTRLPGGLPADQMSELLKGIINAASQVQESLRSSSPSADAGARQDPHDDLK
ncbi:helix-turn-helix transcriptional regulator [Streptomyces triculaminicus]|uniref:Helix-turn-helix transcriptional regulator n=1 Tax=Streptomyces triculaminicus TaxID=2816232 RepID=A0A939FUX1_9ACTN|nr:helix-turn-helix domain-containing protein [Streptomyces triculaminicus]MBO0657259.1 helix-turn-helix transcriptional regulator [Streptomyces triculaminicus]